MTRHILLTGFEPFGGQRVNPSWEVARRFDNRVVDRSRVSVLRLPVDCVRARAAIVAAIDELKPDAVVGLGQAGGRHGLSLEKVALNLADERPVEEVVAGLDSRPVIPGAPAAYFTRLPLRPILDTLHAREVPAAASLTAGVFVCNTVMFTTLHALRRRPRAAAGFVHLPYTNGQAARRVSPSMSLDLMEIGVALVLEVTMAHLHAGSMSQAQKRRTPVSSTAEQIPDPA